MLIAAAGWWVAAVALWPTASRPYIGSTSDNSIFTLIFGYNGLSRIFGNTTGRGPGGGGGGTGFGGTPGLWRLFNGENGGQIAWFIPLAVAGLLAGLWLTRQAPRTDRGRAGWILWGGWAAVSAAVFSLSKGIFHPYYSVQLAPAIAALAGTGGVALWHLGRHHKALGWILPATIVASAAVAVEILLRTPSYHPALRGAIAIGAAVAAAGLSTATLVRRPRIMIAGGAVAVACWRPSGRRRRRPSSGPPPGARRRPDITAFGSHPAADTSVRPAATASPPRQGLTTWLAGGLAAAVCGLGGFFGIQALTNDRHRDHVGGDHRHRRPAEQPFRAGGG